MSVYIIAEAGINHNGDIQLAKELILVAKEAGADAVKFQTFLAERLAVKSLGRASYQKANLGGEETQQQMLQRLELSFDAFAELSAFAKKQEIAFLSTPFDMESIAFLNTLAMPYWKIPSGEITNYPYLQAIARTAKPVILSTGMSTLQEVKDAVSLLQNEHCGNIILLHCTTQYPTSFSEVNLKAMQTLYKEFCLPVGYSDHTLGIEIPIAAAAMGAVVLEKHFTLDRQLPGPDHRASLEPAELKAMVQAVRNVSAALGTGEKKPAASEQKNIAVIRKSIVAKKRILRGEVFTPENLTTKRAGIGLSPMEWPHLLGKAAPRDFQEDEPIQ